MLVPSFNAGFFVSFAVVFAGFDVWFLFFSVEIFVNEIQNGIDALLGIVLFISLKDAVELAKNSFEEIWSHSSGGTVVHLANKLGIGLNHSTLSSHNVFVRIFDDVLVLVLQEELRKLICVL